MATDTIAIGPTEVVYARIPAALKEDVQAFAQRRGWTLAASLSEVLERGLRAHEADAQITQLTELLANKQEEIRAVRQELAQSSALIDTLRERERALQAVADRAAQPLGQCPKCRASVSGTDLLTMGHCPSCKASLTPLLVGKAQGLDQTEMLLLLATLGIVVGLAYASTKR